MIPRDARQMVADHTLGLIGLDSIHVDLTAMSQTPLDSHEWQLERAVTNGERSEGVKSRFAISDG